MKTSRIQKLLLLEYQHLTKEPILIESPFAETTREGIGIREVALGLTSSVFVIAADVLRDNKIFYCHSDIDPDIESLELLSIYPLQFVTLSVFQRRRRKMLKARLIDGRAKYYEIGGVHQKSNCWLTWCEHVQALKERRCLDSSLSETSIIPSSSSESFSLGVKKSDGYCRRKEIGCAKWTQKDLYLGSLYEEVGCGKYIPDVVAVSNVGFKDIKNELKDFSPRRKKDCNCIESPRKRTKKLTEYPYTLIRKLHRFGFGLDEKSSSTRTKDCLNACKFIEDGILIWEKNRKEIRQCSRYISPYPYFLSGLGPWTVQPGERTLSVLGRSKSCAAIRRQPADVELRLPVSRSQMKKNASVAEFSETDFCSRAILFWTTDLWYRPQSAADAYHEIRDHFLRLRTFQERKTTRRPVIKKHHVVALRCALRLRYQVTLWDLDSTTLARQLILIDRELFTRVTVQELERGIRENSSRNSGNLRAWIAFAHRISCLIASEILAVEEVCMRARLVSRLISAANRCLKIGSFNSASSIMTGVQSPALYRLTKTWMYLKTHHATKYELMRMLNETFKSAKMYQEAWRRAECDAFTGIIPFVGDVLRRSIGCWSNFHGTIDKARTGVLVIEQTLGEKYSPTSEEMIDWLLRCQKRAMIYKFSERSLAQEYLLKARYLEDRENFFVSFGLESNSFSDKRNECKNVFQ